MKNISKISVAVLGAALLCVSSALAGGTNKGALNLTEKVTIDGKTLDAGSYKVEWNGDGPNVQVNLVRGKQTVATFPAQVTEGAAPNPSNAYGAVQGPDGSRSLTAIYIGGKHTVLQVGQNAANTQQSSNQDSK